MIILEKLEDFFKILDKIEDKNTPVFITKVKNIGQDYVMSGSLSMGIRSDGESWTLSYSENINDLQMIPKSNVNMLRTVLSSELVGQVDNAIKAKVEIFNQQMNSEYDKAVQLFKNKGFNNIIQASLV